LTHTPVTPSATAFVPSATPSYTPTFTATASVNGSISGFVFRDENGNGNFNPEDTPLSGVTLRIAGGACPASGLVTTTSDSGGNFVFSDLSSGQYCLKVDEGSLPSIGGSWQASLPNPKTVSLNAGEDKGGQNFSFQPVIE
jgi:hypothetical protein